MAKFLVWTDLHNEFWNDIPEIPKEALDVDAILLGGDTSTKGRHLDIASSLYENIKKPIVIILGNHEYYGSTIYQIELNDNLRLLEMQKQGIDIRLLNYKNISTEIAGVRIIGATLWTDMDLYPGHPCSLIIQHSLNDFKRIEKIKGKIFSPHIWKSMHDTDKYAIFSELSVPYNGPTIVMTHHLPIKEMIHPKYLQGPNSSILLNAAFASDLSSQIRKYDIASWISGHSHSNMSTEIEGDFGVIPFISNARGYPGDEYENNFDPGYILSV